VQPHRALSPLRDPGCKKAPQQLQRQRAPGLSVKAIGRLLRAWRAPAAIPVV